MAVQQHADIIAVSYEARALGVKKHMPVSSIRREHPTVKLVHVEVCRRTTIFDVEWLVWLDFVVCRLLFINLSS